MFGILPSSSIYILGDTFLRSAYVVYDLARNEISLAQTVFNSTENNIIELTNNTAVPSTAGNEGRLDYRSYCGWCIGYWIIRSVIVPCTVSKSAYLESTSAVFIDSISSESDESDGNGNQFYTRVDH